VKLRVISDTHELPDEQINSDRMRMVSIKIVTVYFFRYKTDVTGPTPYGLSNPMAGEACEIGTVPGYSPCKT
jgi:hypothetical protein